MSRARRRMEVLWEDRWFLALDKAEGLPVIAPEGSRSACLQDMATAWIRRSNPKGRAAVVHRIDRDSSGLVLMAKDGKGKKAMMDDWDRAVVERLYRAVVLGVPSAPDGVMEDWLKENKAGTVYVAKAGERGAKIARSDWKLLRSGAGRSLLELSLQTGRKHQIRVQLSSRGMPILGDSRYGGIVGRDRPERLFLHATVLAFRHPFTGANIRLECPPPDSFDRALVR